jgi:hypothetical protein
MPIVASNWDERTGGVATIQQEYAKHRGPRAHCKKKSFKLTSPPTTRAKSSVFTRKKLARMRFNFLQFDLHKNCAVCRQI